MCLQAFLKISALKVNEKITLPPDVEGTYRQRELQYLPIRVGSISVEYCNTYILTALVL